MQNIGLVIYKHIRFMSTLADYTDYQLQESEMILRKLDAPLHNITKGIPWIAQKWPGIQLYLLTGNIYLMGEARVEGPSRREILFESESVTKKEAEEEERDILEDSQQEEEEEDIFNPKRTSGKAKSSADKGKGVTAEN